VAKRNKGRPINGVLLLDKPLGLSSNQALQKVKWLFKAAKAGHTGSLDPLATGLLPLCFGEATKISAYLLDADKVYDFSVKLGVRTSTGDAEGEVLQQQPFEHISLTDIQRILPQFRGEISQVPPMHSALKVGGQRLYELARKGEEVERKPRQVQIYSLECTGLEDGIADFRVHCSKGTYVRTLAEDMGEALGCGGHVSRLRRLKVGPYEDHMITLEQLEVLAEQGFEVLDGSLLGLDTGLMQYPDIQLDRDSAYYMGLGQAVQVPNSPTEGLVRLYSQDRFMGIGEIQDDGKVGPKRMMNLPR